MMRSMRTPLLIVVAGLCGFNGPPPAGPVDLYEPPTAALDPRIDPQKVTEHDPPPLPQQVILPVPPEFRVAASADEVPVDRARFERARTALRAGLTWLAAAQDRDGGWLTEVRAAPTDEPDKPSPVAVAVTALAIKAFTQHDEPVLGEHELRWALRFVLMAQGEDGAFEGGALTSYVTAAVVMALSTIDDEDLRDELEQATVWLDRHQWDQGEGLNPRQDWFGGAGYGSRGRPDLSNTQMMLDALYEAGYSPDEPAVQRALSFIARAQNLRATNRADWAGDDGGFVYTPANGGESMASEAAGEGRHGENIAAGRPRSLRSYGSMTYAGFKSMLYAGLSPDDVRVRAAFDWVRRHWTMDENPGLGQQGLYYYYHTMSRSLRAAQQNEIEDIDGVMHNWRAELIDALLDRQLDDGSWRNPADRWLEGEPVMATVYAVLALEETLKPVVGLGADAGGGLRFVVTYDAAIDPSFTGRVYVMLSTSETREPRTGPSWFRPEPFFALDVADWRPDTPLVFDDDALGFPAPPGRIDENTYAVQAVMRRNLDSPFIGRAGGTAYSTVRREAIDGDRGAVELRIDQVAEERRTPDTERVKMVKRRSDLLSDFHGRPIVMEAAVILPESYGTDGTDRYPALYIIPGFGSSHLQAVAFAARATGPDADRIVKIGLNPLCRTGHHVFADSANNGPWGEALVTELIPALEGEFHLAPHARGRFLTGGSSGGWASLWLQVTYPEFFGGTWSMVPDPVDFRSFQGVDLYEPGSNMFVDVDGERRPIARRRGEVMLWYDDFAGMERVWGEGGQLSSFDAVFSPRGADGRPQPFFDRLTGDVNRDVIEAWKQYDIRLILEENWPTLGPKLAGKLHVFAGEDDNFYLEDAVKLLDASLETLGSDAVVEVMQQRNHMTVGDRAMLQRIDRELLAIFDGDQ